jgi:hypothetical protein
VVDAWLRADVGLEASVIHGRLVDQYGFGGHYQRVKMYVAEAGPGSWPSSAWTTPARTAPPFRGGSRWRGEGRLR